MSELPGGGGTVALGVLVGLVSASIQSLGLTLQRKSHLLEEEKEEDNDYVRRPPYRRRRWQIGMFMFLISNIVGSTIQITTLPLPVLSTLQASGLVFNTACATLILKEPFTRYSIIGTILVAGGAVLIALFGAMSEPSHNLDQLLTLLGQRGFLIWVTATFVVVAAILVAIWLQERIRLSHRPRLWLGLAYGSVSGILSAHCLLLAKSAVELIVRTIVDRINQFDRWQSWSILIGLIILALSQLYYLHRGLKLCSTSVLYPFVFCIYNIIAILDGLIYFRQASRISSLHAGLIALGTVILLAGVFALSWRLDPEYKALSTAASDPKAIARVAAPHSALAPGMGIIETEEPIAAEPHFLRPADDDDTLRNAHHLHLHSPPTEATPLLRTSTAPMAWRLAKAPRTTKDKTTTQQTSSSFRPPRVRRLTSPDTAANHADLWDELHNDSNESSRRFSGAFSPQLQRSPSASRILRRSRRTASQQQQQRPKSASGLFGTLTKSLRWPSLDKGKRRDHDTSTSPPAPPPIESGDDEDDDTDDAEGEGTVRRYRPWRSASGHQQHQQRRRSDGNIARTAGEGWFKLKWWKRRWRWDEEEGVEGGDGAEEQRV